MNFKKPESGDPGIAEGPPMRYRGKALMEWGEGGGVVQLLRPLKLKAFSRPKV